LAAASVPTIRMPPRAIRRQCRRARDKDKEAKLCFGGHVLIENRNGLCVDIRVTSVLERETAAAELLKAQARKHQKPTSLGADKGYHSRACADFSRRRAIRPHNAQNDGRDTPGWCGASAAARRLGRRCLQPAAPESVATALSVSVSGAPR
jgi:hypothetical protein